MQASVYRYYDDIGLLLYVGITERGVVRNFEHSAFKDWWPFVVRQEVDHFDTRAEAAAEEKRLIRQYRPPYNVQHNAGVREIREAYLALRRAQGRPPAEIIRQYGGFPLEYRNDVFMPPMEAWSMAGRVKPKAGRLTVTWQGDKTDVVGTNESCGKVRAFGGPMALPVFTIMELRQRLVVTRAFGKVKTIMGKGGNHDYVISSICIA